MMRFRSKKMLGCIMCIILSTVAVAQKQSNNWYFGSMLGLNFNNQPPTVLYNGGMRALESSSVISDAEGRLLFYSNGVEVFNKNHVIMQDGGGIEGDLSSTCNSVIIQLPGNDSLYYLFTTGAGNGAFKSLKYSIINIKAGGGLGAVVSRNQEVEGEVFEKIAAVRHCNRKDAWIAVKKFNTDEYHSYLLTATGLAAPVISHTGLVITGDEVNMIGAFKFSEDGKKAVAIHPYVNNAVELMDFNNATGVLSNPVVFKPNGIVPDELNKGMYGAEFSPNGKLLYISATNSITSPCVLYQLDISSGIATNILNSKLELVSTRPLSAGGLQLGPDKKIYFTIGQGKFLSVIENPDVYGTGCNFLLNSIVFPDAKTGQGVLFGLPTFVASDMDSNYAAYNFSTQRTAGCDNLDVSFHISSVANIDSVLWDFGDGQQSKLFAPLHTYPAAADYAATLTLYGRFCTANDFQKVTQTVKVGSKAGSGFLPADTEVCTVKDIVLKTTIPADSYTWSTGSTTDSITLSVPGTYWLDIEVEGCTSRDSFTIAIQAAAGIDLGRDTFVCANKGIMLDAGPITQKFTWNTGDTTRTIFVNKAGAYSISTTVGDCLAGDTVIVAWGDCDFYVPNAFTPNGDHLNDYFGPVSGFSTNFYKMTIYNRYGYPIFTTADPGQKWDGTFKGKAQPAGTYAWVILYNAKSRFATTEKGTVTLIR